jgi:hypothetical protein
MDNEEGKRGWEIQQCFYFGLVSATKKHTVKKAT